MCKAKHCQSLSLKSIQHLPSSSPPPLFPLHLCNTQKKQFTPLGYPLNSKENISFAQLSLIVEILKHSNWPFQTHWISSTRWQQLWEIQRGGDARNHGEEISECELGESCFICQALTNNSSLESLTKTWVTRSNSLASFVLNC